MPLPIYMDHHVPRAIALGLRLRRVDVLTTYEDGASALDNAALWGRARELGRVLFRRDDDLLAEAAKRQREEIPFHGIVYAHQLRVSSGTCVQDLEIIAKAGEPAELLNGVMSYLFEDSNGLEAKGLPNYPLVTQATNTFRWQSQPGQHSGSTSHPGVRLRNRKCTDCLRAR